MARRDLTAAWTAAEAALPDGWLLKGVVLGPRVADPAIGDAQWVAWARSSENGEAISGHGATAVDALHRLADELGRFASG